MKKIIVFPGSADGVFFLNEIKYIKKQFDEVVVITYPGNNEKFNILASEYKFRLFIADIKFKNMFTFDFIEWLFSKSTLLEIRNAISFSLSSFKKVGYIILYGLFYLSSKKYIDKELNTSIDDDIFLYSFWLTRGAYAISMYNSTDRKCIKKIVSRAHGYDLYENRNSLNYLPFRDYINNNLDYIHFISSNGLEYHKTKYANSKSSRNIFRLGTLNSQNFVKKIVNKDVICIASCSYVSSVKRIDLIIDILSMINTPFRWIHIGSGDLINEIKEYAKLKLTNINFEFLGELKNEDILRTYMKYDVDFFINMSDSEGVPVSMMEAMSLGIPIIARNVGGIPEIVDEKTGYVVSNIDDLSCVSSNIQVEMESRLLNVDYYLMKHVNCINKWTKEYNADFNYENFFLSLKNII